MQDIKQTLRQVDWQTVEKQLDAQGYGHIYELLSAEQCAQLTDLYDRSFGFRKTVAMEKHNYGRGEYKYFDYPLPTLIQELRAGIYPHLAGTASRWMQLLNIERTYPDTLEKFLQICHEHEQRKATPLILRYGPGGFNTMHQDMYGEVFFPLQVVLMLSKPDRDFTGGDFVLTEQRARSQARATVLQPGRGDAVIFTSSFYPAPSAAGFSKANVKHGVSTVLSGRRHTAGIIFHDAAS